MKHLEVAHTVVDFLHKSFPDASIALGGSVAEFFFLGKTVILIFCL